MGSSRAVSTTGRVSVLPSKTRRDEESNCVLYFNRYHFNLLLSNKCCREKPLAAPPQENKTRQVKKAYHVRGSLKQMKNVIVSYWGQEKVSFGDAIIDWG